jgi:SAM-dependent methyltransferase
MTPEETYRRVRYDNFPIAQTHPARLHALAKMAGLNPPAVDTCRVLELGASEGVNLIPMAHRFPRSEFVGIDLAADAIGRGQAFVQEFGLTNVRLDAIDLLEVDASFGEFDYIIAHGVYAWTPEAVRDKVLAIAGALLSPHGVAFISYNTQPAGHIRRMVREMMLFHARGSTNPEEQVAKGREMLSLLARERGTQEVDRMDAYDAVLAAHAAELLHQRPGNQMLHDDLALAYEPVAFSDFVAHARCHGLQYVDDAGALDPRGDAGPKDIEKSVAERVRTMAAGDRIVELQYHDYLRMRRFRQSLVCRADVNLSAEWNPANAAGLHASTRLVEVADGEFAFGTVFRIATTHPVPVRFLRRLIKLWPGSEPVRKEDAGVAAALFRAGAVELLGAPSVAARAGDRPCADELIRFQARRGDPILTTLWHEPLEVDDGMRQLLTMLDGNRDRETLAREASCSEQEMRGQLDGLTDLGVLIESSRCESKLQP